MLVFFNLLKRISGQIKFPLKDNLTDRIPNSFSIVSSSLQSKRAFFRDFTWQFSICIKLRFVAAI